ncbi:hypothetical protein [Bacillus tuaregi]|uniref:hypothetical protein n=1 Tax=Bacillus tuaregi TaxID=1816695 RepID=UPI0008F87A1A|nr:hypothetical protein [Bacillus tuaregi]
MDKPRNGKTIKIKINGKDNPFNEGQKGGPPDQKTIGREPGEQPSRPKESVERESAATKETTEDGEKFDWILPSGTSLPKSEEESNIIYLKDKKQEKLVKPFTALWSQIDSSKKLKPKSKGKPNFKGFNKFNSTLLLSVVFAIIVGTFFGLILLKLVPSDEAAEMEATTTVNEEEAEQPIASGSVAAALQPFSVAVVQEGVYSSQGNADEILAGIKEKGIPAAVIPTDGKFAIYVSVAATIEDAKALGKEMEGKGLTTFSKEFTTTEKKISLQHNEEKKLLEASPQLYKTLTASVTTAGLSNRIPEDVMANVEKEASMLSNIDKEKLQTKSVIQLYNELEAASAQIKEFEKKPDENTLTKIQQSLLTILASYQSLQ